MNPKVDFFFEKAKKWKDEYAALRTTILDFGLTEELKWGTPCYTFEGKNIVLIHGFKDYCALLFHFSSAKQAKTREARIEKNIPNILDGKGLED